MGPLALLVPLLGTVLDRVLPDTEARRQAMAELTTKAVELEAQQNAAQAEVNKVEASHPSLWVSGWRPAVGWSCAAALAWSFLVLPILQTVLLTMGRTTTLPTLMTDNLWELVFAMLGLGGLRSIEKIKGAATGKG